MTSELRRNVMSAMGRFQRRFQRKAGMQASSEPELTAQDLASRDLALSSEEVRTIESLAG